jgi:hypothetical protein
MEGGVPNDITPIRRTAAAGAATFAATDGSSVLTVTDTLHGAIAGAYVTFSATTSLGGAITAECVLNAEYQITNVLSSSTYEIDVGVNANASDVGDGGAGTIAAYQINPGLDTVTFGTGMGHWHLVSWHMGVQLHNLRCHRAAPHLVSGQLRGRPFVQRPRWRHILLGRLAWYYVSWGSR